MEAAGGGEERRDRELVEANESDGEDSHAVYYAGPSAEVTSAASWAKGACAATGRAMTSRRIVPRGVASASRTIADKRRRSLFRTTAFPTDLLTVMPIKDETSPASGSLR